MKGFRYILQYYNHQGSVALVTGMTGRIHQHLQYLPYGGIFVDVRGASVARRQPAPSPNNPDLCDDFWSPYTFSAKEKDSESGYNYFGARYYTDNIMMWLSVDPMSDKYPSMSPYMYCAGNPIKLVDPDGMDIDPTASGYKSAQDAANKYAAFRKIYNKWKSDPNIVVKFNHTDGGGNIGYHGKDESGRDVYSVNWDPRETKILGTEGIFEETYHLNEAIDGVEMNFSQNPDGSWGCENLDINDEVRAKQWVAENFDIKKYFNIDDNGNRGFTHYGYIQLRNSKDKIRNDLRNGVVKNSININGFNSKTYSVPKFGGEYSNRRYFPDEDKRRY